MSALDHTPVADLAERLGASGDSDAARALARAVAWRLYHGAATRSLRFRVGPVPVSVKVAKLRPLFVLLFGEDPGDAASDAGAAGAVTLA